MVPVTVFDRGAAYGLGFPAEQNNQEQEEQIAKGGVVVLHSMHTTKQAVILEGPSTVWLCVSVAIGILHLVDAFLITIEHEICRFTCLR